MTPRAEATGGRERMAYLAGLHEGAVNGEHAVNNAETAWEDYAVQAWAAPPEPAPPGEAPWAGEVRDALAEAIGDWRIDDSCGPPCVCDGDNVALQVLCRAFDEDPADLIEEWRAFDKSGWLWWGRALGAFIRRKIDAHLQASEEPTREEP